MDPQTIQTLPQHLRDYDAQVMLCCGALAVQDPESMAQRLAAAQATGHALQDALARADAAVAQGKADRTRLSALLAERARATSERIAALQTECIDCPAADIDALARMADLAQQGPRFLGSALDELVAHRLPVAMAQAASARADALAAETQVYAWQAVELYGEFTRLAGPLARTLGASSIATPPTIREAMDRVYRAWREERDARDQAERAVRELSALDQARISARIG